MSCNNMQTLLFKTRMRPANLSAIKMWPLSKQSLKTPALSPVPRYTTQALWLINYHHQPKDRTFWKGQHIVILYYIKYYHKEFSMFLHIYNHTKLQIQEYVALAWLRAHSFAHLPYCYY
jgi:hypothetical protein